MATPFARSSDSWASAAGACGASLRNSGCISGCESESCMIHKEQDPSVLKNCRHCWASTSAFLPTHGVRHMSIHSTAGSNTASAAPSRTACTLWGPRLQDCAAPLIQQACKSRWATSPMGSQDFSRLHTTISATLSLRSASGTDVFACLCAPSRCQQGLHTLNLEGVTQCRAGSAWSYVRECARYMGITHNAYACNQQQRAQRQSGALRSPLGPVKGNCGGHRQA